MTLRKFIFQIHLWLGIVSGLILFIVCITGAIWVFNEEITSFINPVPKIEKEQNKLLPPSQLIQIASSQVSNDSAVARTVQYKQSEAVRISFTGKQFSSKVYVNPYSGHIMKAELTPKDKQNFFRFILNGHRFLWLPWKIGRPIVNYSTLVFVVVLLSGIVLWWPKTKKALKASVLFIWKKDVGLKRKLYDLHNVLGFYSFFVLLFIALTGMVWGIKWYSEGVYKITSGGKSLPERQAVQSDTLHINDTPILLYVDKAFQKVQQKEPSAERFLLILPDASQKFSAIIIYVYPDAGKYFSRRSYVFDRYTSEEINLEGPYYSSYKEASGADKLRRLNYDIHTGSIFGLTGKIIVFFAALIGASLPVTGIWLYIRRQVNKRKNRNKFTI